MTSKRKLSLCAATFTVTSMIVLPPSVWSDTVAGLNVFTAGETASSSEVNANFNAIESAVNGTTPA